MSAQPSGSLFAVPIEGRVARILNERELVINVGKAKGVREGMVFGVLAEESLNITDPITGESLGDLERYKVQVEATQVLDAMAVCRTFSYREVGGSPIAEAMASIGSISAMVPRRRIYETLNAEKEQLPRPLPPEKSYVKVGDRVRRLPKNPD